MFKSLFFILYFLFSFSIVSAITADELRQNIQNQLQDLEQQFGVYREQANQNSSQAKTLAEETARLDKKIKRQELEVKRLDLNIQQLNLEISDAETNIQGIGNKIQEIKKLLIEYLKTLHSFGDTTILKLVLARDKFSDLFLEIKSLEDVENKVYESYLALKDLKIKLNIQRDNLDNEKDETLSLKNLAEVEKQQLKTTKQQKDALLKETKGKEKIYQALVKKTTKDITSLKNQLYILRGNEKLRFEDAVALANFAAKKTGIRPAFLLGVLSHESDLGGNIGKGTWQEDMANPRCSKQKEAFLQITDKLGLDPNKVPVSRRAWYGYCGGAMGPAQFIPTTWLLYEDRVSQITGNKPSSPWNMKDAFTAAALFLTDSGAAKQTPNTEWKAAMIYLAGSNWSKSSLSSYGYIVLDLASQFQEQIDILNKA